MENRFSILIIDDVEENIYSLKLLIEEFDVDIYSALSASEGVLEILCQSDRIYFKGLNNESNT
jgi:CheY-like chemotaxis protein